MVGVRLPSWDAGKLGEVSEIIMGQSPQSTFYNEVGEGLPFYQGKKDFGSLYPTPRRWCSRPIKIAKADDVLISVRAPVGPTNLCRERSCIGRGLAAIRAGEGLNSEFLLWYLRSIEKQLGQLSERRGSTFGAITKKELSNLAVPLPSLPQQQRTVEYIEKLRERIEEVRGLRHEAAKDMGELLQTTMSQVFSGAEEWEVKQIGGIVADVKSGFACSKKNTTPSGIPHLRPFNIGLDGELDMSKLLRFPPDLVDLETYGLVSGDILFNNTNSVELVGKSAMVSQNLQAGFSNHLTRIRVRSEIVEPEWLLYCLRNFWQGRVFERNCHRWIGQAGFNSRELLEMEVPIPSITEQRPIISHIRTIESRAVEFRHLLGQTDWDLDELADAVLEKAFKLHTFSDVLAEGGQVLHVERDHSKGRGLRPAQETLSRYTSSE